MTNNQNEDTVPHGTGLLLSIWCRVSNELTSGAIKVAAACAHIFSTPLMDFGSPSYTPRPQY